MSRSMKALLAYLAVGVFVDQSIQRGIRKDCPHDVKLTQPVERAFSIIAWPTCPFFLLGLAAIDIVEST